MKISKSAIFLFELMFVILVFAVSAAVCANIFGQAHKYSAESRDLTRAVLLAENAAEEFKANREPAAEYVNRYDKDWIMIPEEEKSKAYHSMTVSITNGDGLEICEITFREGIESDGKVIYELTARRAYG